MMLYAVGQSITVMLKTSNLASFINCVLHNVRLHINSCSSASMCVNERTVSSIHGVPDSFCHLFYIRKHCLNCQFLSHQYGALIVALALVNMDARTVSFCVLFEFVALN